MLIFSPKVAQSYIVVAFREELYVSQVSIILCLWDNWMDSMVSQQSVSSTQKF